MMPIERIFIDGKPAFRWGSDGTVYPYNPRDPASIESAKNKAQRQGRAIEAKRNRGRY